VIDTTEGGAAPVEHDRRREATARLGRAFKGAMAAVRRLRGHETRNRDAITNAQYGLLFGLCDHDELSLSELAVAADLSPATATEMLDGLAAAGLVRRARSDTDRRVVLISLTARGRTAVVERHAHYESRWNDALAEFSDEDLERAAAVLDRMREMFDDLRDRA
jgi:DNA-binding MarR family transcriptional regulator